VLSAVGFGSMALFANIAYQQGVDAINLLMLRFVLAALVLGIVCFLKKFTWPPQKITWGYVAMGMIYTAMSWCYFFALQKTSSSTVALILYTYPILVVLISSFLKIDHMGKAEVLALVFSSIGLLIMLGGNIAGEQIGLVFAFASAVFYSGYIVLGAILSRHKPAKITTESAARVHPMTATTVILTTAAICFTLIALNKGIQLPTNLTAWGAVSSIALIGTALSISMLIAGIYWVGPSLAAVLSTIEPLITVSLGVLFLKETLYTHTLIGGILILASAFLLTLMRMKHKATNKNNPQSTRG
jgi:drug/metabolite transporter (DMT)-like permease